MKSAYEIAMERLNKTQPMAKLTEAQKKRLAELETEYNAKLAERELFLKNKIASAVGQGDQSEVQQLEEQLHRDRKSLQAELEEKKEKVRQGELGE